MVGERQFRWRRRCANWPELQFFPGQTTALSDLLGLEMFHDDAEQRNGTGDENPDGL